MIVRTIIFLVINFVGLGIGSYFTSKGVPSDWYTSMNQAPWTPPGWVFGFAWTTIMICFAVYMAYAYKDVRNHISLLGLFFLQWSLNVMWNPAFFYFHNILLGLIIISLLTILIGYFLIGFYADLKWKALFVLPYFVWLIIATSLNLYIYLNN